MTERPLSLRRRRDTRGAIYVEVLVAIIPVMIFFFGLLQLAMFYSARLIVRHAAWRAVRTAVVVLDDDPERYEGQERRMIYAEDGSTAPSSSSAQGFADSIGEALGVSLPATGLGSANKAGPRLSAIQRSAYMALAVLAPTPSKLLRNFGVSALEDVGNGARFLTGLMLYNRAAAMVTLRKPDGEYANDVPSDGDVTVRISYLYYCGMPIVNYIMCDTLPGMAGFDQLGDAVKNAYQTIVSEGPQAASAAAEGFQDDLERASAAADARSRELKYVESPELLLPLMFSRAHFKMITAEATLPNQGACYYDGSSCYGTDDTQ